MVKRSLENCEQIETIKRLAGSSLCLFFFSLCSLADALCLPVINADTELKSTQGKDDLAITPDEYQHD